MRTHANGMTALVITIGTDDHRIGVFDPEEFRQIRVIGGPGVDKPLTHFAGTLEAAKAEVDCQTNCPQPCNCEGWRPE